MIVDLKNLRKQCKKHFSVRSKTNSRCTALVAAHVNRQTYTVDSSLYLFRTVSASVKSTLLILNGVFSWTRSFGKGRMSGAE